ncbi:hypothetical protein QR680_013599 [Steinernema hermaphroditum]|uniref:Peptidase S1 domain-containing protein n=1 Tax=Steinernema hermaphroditum TaxID=289476 RepID=A0AA39M2S8_9BILA|nr:hypothetical protein QR680_013599 [Steinernema hermaphroditum]
MRIFLALPLLLSTSLALPLPNPEHKTIPGNVSELIWGGKESPLGMFPFQASLSIKKSTGYMYCGGTLLTKRHILTAAHCITGFRKGSMAMLGITDRLNPYGSPWAQVMDIESVNIHPRYRHGNDFPNDIGIITLVADVNITNYVRPIQIKADDDDLATKGNGWITGFGMYKFINGRYLTSRDLLWAIVPIINWERCREIWDSITLGDIVLSDKQMCAGAKGKGIGKGDSGGPIFVMRTSGTYQIGLTSFLVSTEEDWLHQDDYPSVFTRVAKYCDYIAENTQHEFVCE